jgi:histidyl-tRNA synthetase
LVRGLDYYTGTIFEIKAKVGDLGAQNTVCGGGRYDRLVSSLGGPEVPAMGFGLGVERLLLAMTAPAESFEPGLALYIAALGDKARTFALPVAHRCAWPASAPRSNTATPASRPSSSARTPCAHAWPSSWATTSSSRASSSCAT